ncbi:MAG: CheR family methyltransferase, partial [Pseudomonadota bacterium]
ASGAVDLTLTIEDMAEVLRDYKSRRNGIEPFIDNEHEFVGRVFKHVRFHTGQDFTQYKLSTLMRRLTLRMAALGQISPADYLERLIQDRGEAFKLQQDVLINVTRFFRDEDAFKTLQKDIIPQILNDRGRDETVRIWVPGCSTGEEAYTIGMLVAEGVAQSSNEPDVTIFGTDIDEDALQMARQGHYPNHIVEHIPEDLLQRYFVPTADGFNVGKKLRRLVRFSNQSLIKDPPFSKLDLISCRNVLIYFEKAWQEHALNIFHYALKPDGFLFLGTSENPQATHSGFMEVSATDHIYRRDQNPSQPLNLPLGPFGGDRLPATLSNDRERTMKRSVDAVRDAILERHGLPFIVTSGTGLVSHISPGAEKFIKLRSGDMQTEIGRIIHPALESIIRRLNNQNTEKEGEVTGAHFSGEIEGEMVTLEVTSERVPSGERFFVFHPSDSPIPKIDRRVEASTGEESAYVRGLEQELDDARQTVRTTVEELETSNEELKSSNEEMMSMNEELQSSNEELSTMNDELQSKILETQELNSDLRGFIASTGLATVFLDTSFCVRRFTPEAKTYFRFAESDIGRSVEDIASTLPVSKIIDLCKEVVSSEQVREINISAKDKSIQLIRAKNRPQMIIISSKLLVQGVLGKTLSKI